MYEYCGAFIDVEEVAMERQFSLILLMRYHYAIPINLPVHLHYCVLNAGPVDGRSFDIGCLMLNSRRPLGYCDASLRDV